jgi:DNA-binding NarL/FixJ family response regulator
MMCLESFCWKIFPDLDYQGGIMAATRIFLAEGQNHVRQAIHLSLDQQQGFQVIGSAGHAESLLAQITQLHPDALLLDWLLPGLNPQRLFPVIRQYCPKTRIIAMVLQPKMGKMAQAYGVDSYILKSLQPEDFSESLIGKLDIK